MKIREILLELEFRSGEVINLKSPRQIAILSEILDGTMYRSIKQEFITNLLEGPNDGDNAKSSKEVEDEKSQSRGYTSIGGAYYVKNADAEKRPGNEDGYQSKKDDSQRYVLDKDSGNFKPTDDKEEPAGIEPKDLEKSKEGGAEEQEDDSAIEDAEAQANIKKTMGTDDYQDQIKDEESAVKKASEEDKPTDGDVYSVGGGYYSSRPNGPKEYRRVDEASGVETHVTDKGNTIKLKPLDGVTVPTKEEKQDLKYKREDAEKVLHQIHMTDSEAKKTQKGVGLGTAESRTGESVTVYSGQKIQQLMESGHSYEESRDMVKHELDKIASDDKNVLTNEWVQSGLSILNYLNDTVGIENVKHFAWDTEGAENLLGIKGHGTSADMFIETKEGEKIGVSLKKSFKVFLVNGGYGSSMKNLEEKLGTNLPENTQPAHHKKRRKEEFQYATDMVKNNRKDFEEAAAELLRKPKLFNKIFGPGPASYRKRAKFIQDSLGIKNYKKATPEQMVDLLENPTNADKMKFAAAFFKSKPIEEKYKLYGNLRSLDNEMTENIFDYFNNNADAQDKFTEKIVEDTHIIDTLFPKAPLDDFKTIFGENPAVEMTKESIVEIFGLHEYMKHYDDAKDAEEKIEIENKIKEAIKNKLVLVKKKGVPVVAISLTDSVLPLYKLGVRTRGIGNAQTLEVAQEVFGSLSLKNGNTNVESWSVKDKRTVVDAESNDIIKSLEQDSLDLENIDDMNTLIQRVTTLKKWSPYSSKLKKVQNKLWELKGIEIK